MANFYITDRKYNLIDIVSTDGQTEIVANSIVDTQSIEDSARDFEATFYFEDDSFKLAKKLTSVGNFVLYKDREGQSVFITIESREINATDCLVQITGKDASIDLINEVVAPYTPDKAYSIVEYITRFTSDSGFEIGENAIPDKKLKLEEWTSEATALERILSVATRFDVEISFSFEIDGLDVVKRYINIVEKRGKSENITLYANKEIESITIKEDSYDLFTAIKPVGAVPEGKETPINLNNYKYTDPDGRYVLSGGILKDNKVVQEWSRLLSNEVSSPTGAHITRYKEYDTDNQAKLFTMAMTDLKKYAQLNVNYEVVFYEFPTSVSIGDTINLVDEDKEIYLSARVLTLSYDYISDTAEAVVGDYLIKDSGISKDLENLAASMKDKFANVNENLNGKAVIVKSDTAPEPGENIIWVDTSHPQTPIKTYDPETGEWLVSTGEAGKDGIAGKDGLGVKSTVITYAISTSPTDTPSSGWTNQVPTLQKGKYLWTKTQWTYTDNTVENGYTVSYIAKDGNDGNDGVAGKDGVGIANTLVQYVGSTSGTTKPTSGWSTTIPTVAEGNFLWTKTTWTYTDGTKEDGYSVAKMGAKGEKGDPGAKGNDGIAGKDGVGLKETVIRYAGSSNGTTAPTSGWQSTVPIVLPGNFLWTRTTWTYTDNTSEIGYSVSRIGADGNDGEDGIAGKDGTGIKSTTITYVGSTNGTTPPSTGWTSTIPTVADGNYLWTKTVWFYTDNTSETGYSVAKMGAKGADGKDGIAGKDGVGIKNTTIQYASSTSGTTAPTTGWQTNVPTVAAGNYLWTRTTWTYTDNTTETGYAVSRIGKDGNTGKDGIAGKDGVGIKATSIQYAGSTSGTTPPTTGWTASVPTVASGSYLWTKTTWSYTDDTSETGYSVSKMGETGAKGDTGASATSYWITPSVNTIQISATKVLNPTTITFTGYSKTGTANAGLYAGRFNILTSVDGIVYSSKYSSSANQSAYTYTVPADVKFIKARMYQAGGFTALVDEQTIPIIESAEGLISSEKNLLLKSNVPYSGTAYGTWWKMTEFMEAGVDYVLKVKGSLGTGKTYMSAFLDGGTINLGSLTDNGDGTHSLKFKGKNGSRTDYNQLYLYFMPGSVTATNTIEWIKLIKGNTMFSQWSPAPEEAQLYPAWSNDPNGKDMVRIYPNENLALGTQFKTVDDWAMTWATTNGTKTLTNDGLKLTATTANQTGMGGGLSRQLVYGEIVTITFKFRGLGAVEPYFLMKSGSNLPITNVTSTSTTTWQEYSRDYAFPNRTEGILNFSILVRGVDNWIEIKKDSVKIEVGNKTIYTTPPSEDPVKAEMAYIGYSPKDSNDPADYVWSENPKAKGTFKRWSNDPSGLIDMTATYPSENTFSSTTTMTTLSGGVIGIRDEVNAPRGFKFTGVNGGTGSFRVNNVITENGEWTVSFKVRGSQSTSVYFSLNICGSPVQKFYTTADNTWKEISMTVNITNWTEDAYNFVDFSNIGWAYFFVSDFKVSKGKKNIYTTNPMDDPLNAVPQYVGIGSKDTMNPADFVWNINPEYNQARTDLGLDSKVDDETFNDAQDHLNELIDSKANQDELAKLNDIADALKESYEGFTAEGGRYEADLQALEARVTGLLIDLEDKVLDLDFLKTNMRLGEEGFEIGQEGSSLKMVLDNNVLSFRDGGREVAYFSNQEFYINRGAILESLQVGSHKLTKVSAKMTVFQYAPPK